MRVLLVEDSILLQQTVGTALRRSGYAVDISGDGEDGLWRAEATNTGAKKVWRAGRPVKLKPREYQLLEYLARRLGEIVTQTDIEQHLYDEAAEPMSNVVESNMTNLVENAVEYSPPGATVRIHSDAQEGCFNLAVTNPVEHLETADLPNLGDRFWRKDAARSSRDHSGLGLSVVRALAAALGCNLKAAMNESAWLSMTVSGPIRPRNHSAPPISNAGKTEKQTQ